MNTLTEQYPEEIKRILSKYPEDQRQSAVMPLLYLAQRKEKYISRKALTDIADITGLSPTNVASIVGFYTLYYDKLEGKYRIQVCTDLPCALRGADEFLQNLCENVGVKVGGTTPDGKVTIEEVMCMAGCDKAPMFQLQNGDQITYHENQTVESTTQLIENLRQEKEERFG